MKKSAKIKHAKAAKAKAPIKAAAATPDWLRKAMAPKAKPKGNPPEVSKPVTPVSKPKKGKRMATSKDKSVYDPVEDADLKAPEPTQNAKVEGGEAEPDPQAAADAAAKAAADALAAMTPEDLITDVLGGSGDARDRAKAILKKLQAAGHMPADKEEKAEKKAGKGK